VSDRFQSERDELVGMIQSTGATPEQYTQALEYLRAVNSRDPALIGKAVDTLQAELKALAGITGKVLPGVDLLAEHEDLRTAIEDGSISREHAQEIAAARALRAQQSQAMEINGQQQQRVQAINGARQQLNELEAQIKAVDPQWLQKKGILMGQFRPLLAQLPPSAWAATFVEMYRNLHIPAAVAAVPTARSNGNGAGQPLRAHQPAGNSHKEPTSMLEALNAGIEMASRQ
jgi:hypothetical protein